MWSPGAAGQHANTVRAFEENPDMGWTQPARISDGIDSDAAEGAEGGGALMGQLRTVETMVASGVMGEEEGRRARARILGLQHVGGNRSAKL